MMLLASDETVTWLIKSRVATKIRHDSICFKLPSILVYADAAMYVGVDIVCSLQDTILSRFPPLR